MSASLLNRLPEVTSHPVAKCHRLYYVYRLSFVLFVFVNKSAERCFYFEISSTKSYRNVLRVISTPSNTTWGLVSLFTDVDFIALKLLIRTCNSQIKADRLYRYNTNSNLNFYFTEKQKYSSTIPLQCAD